MTRWYPGGERVFNRIVKYSATIVTCVFLSGVAIFITLRAQDIHSIWSLLAVLGFSIIVGLLSLLILAVALIGLMFILLVIDGLREEWFH